MTGAPNSKAAQQGQDIKASFGSIFSKPALEYFWAWMWWFQLSLKAGAGIHLGVKSSY
jgi:hypothetical protein